MKGIIHNLDGTLTPIEKDSRFAGDRKLMETLDELKANGHINGYILLLEKGEYDL